ncbi:MAG: hypothetical protein KKF44_02595, partial [Nanoarchaeota archaeon]|nr:hypothetical protein [Nanoarchaeota archaeon]
MVKIRLIESLEDLEPISKEWDRLIKKSTVNNIFLTWDWMYVWYRHFGKGKRLFVLVCYEKDELIGIAPLVISSVFLGKKYDVLEFMGGEEACGEYLDFIIKNGKEEICINLIVKHLISSEKVCDFIHLSDVSSDSGLLALALKRFEKNGMKQISDIGRKIYYVKMSASIEDYLSGLSKNVRRNL